MRPGRRRRSRQRPAALLFKLPLGVRVTWLSARLCGEHPEPEPDQAGVRHAGLMCTCAREQNAFATWRWAPRRWSPPIPAPRLRATFPAPTTDSSGVRGGHSTQQLEAARGGRPGAGRSGAAQGTCLAFEGPRVLLQQRQRRPAAGRVGSGPETPAQDGARARLCRETHPALHLSTLAGGAETPARPRFRAGHRRRHLDCAETGTTARGEKTERIRFHCVNCRQVAKPDLCP